ncbi:MAG: hypothetical protein P1U37_00960, partial [Minwuia sp.]|nr:hypothetical protein [Minwuia sp.]
TSLGFDALILQDMVMTPSAAYLDAGEDLVIRVGLSSATVNGWRKDGADSILLSGLAATAAGSIPASSPASSPAAAEGVAEFAIDSLSVTDWQKGAPGKIGTVGKVSMTGLSEMLQLPDNVLAVQDPEVARMMQTQGPFLFSVETYQLTDLRYDPQVLALWQSLIEYLAAQEPGAKPDPAELTEFLEAYLVILERARDLQTGIGHAGLTGMKARFGEATSVSIDRLDIREIFGLKGGSFEVAGISQQGAGDARSSIERYQGRVGDLSALPAWLRTVFGTPLTQDSLQKARAWAAGKTLAELVPVFDLGTFSMEGLDAAGPDGKPVRVDFFAIESIRVGADASVEMAFRMDGISAPLDSAAGTQPQAAMLLQMLKANGVEDLQLGTAISLKAGLADSTGALGIGMSGTGLAELTAELDLTGVDFEKLRHAPAQQRNMVALSSDLARARITLIDQGLRLLLLESQAAQRPGATAEMIGTQFAAMAEQMGASMGTDASRAIGQQLAAFITAGGTLEVSTGLQTPLPVIQLMGLQRQPPASIIDTLGITAIHSAP